MRFSYEFVKYLVWAVLSLVGLGVMLLSANMAVEPATGSVPFLMGTCPWVFGLGYSLAKVWFSRPQREDVFERAVRFVRKRDGK